LEEEKALGVKERRKISKIWKYLTKQKIAGLEVKENIELFGL
jgi:hypothetical protein